MNCQLPKNKTAIQEFNPENSQTDLTIGAMDINFGIHSATRLFTGWSAGWGTNGGSVPTGVINTRTANTSLQMRGSLSFTSENVYDVLPGAEVK
jgi:hypothetical protein